MKDFNNNLRGFAHYVWKTFKPRHWIGLDWQNFLWASVICWILSLPGVELLLPWATQRVFATLSWLLAIVGGISWALNGSTPALGSLSLQPWLAGGLTCVLADRLLVAAGASPSSAQAIAVMSWPLVSFLFLFLPDLLGGEARWQLSARARQQAVLWFLAHLLATCWLGFLLLTQAWVAAEPAWQNAAKDPFQGSRFVVNLGG